MCIWNIRKHRDRFKCFPTSLIFQDVVLFETRLSILIPKQLNTHFLMHVRSWVMGGFGGGLGCFQSLCLIVGGFRKRHQNTASVLPISCVAVHECSHVCTSLKMFLIFKVHGEDKCHRKTIAFSFIAYCDPPISASWPPVHVHAFIFLKRNSHRRCSQHPH